MTEEELEAQIQSYDVESASLAATEYGRFAADSYSFECISNQQERSALSTYLFRLPKQWCKTRGRGVRVAILDTGVDLNHPCLSKAITKHADFTGQGVEDNNGHGSHSAGIIAGKNYSLGMLGLAPDSDLLIGKVLDDRGVGRCSDIAEGIDWAVDAGAHIINLSMCSENSSPLLYRSITYALAKGIHIVCAVGNVLERSPQTTSFPARYGSLLSVSTLDGHTNGKANGSGILAAPGESIWSCYREGGYQELSGSSVAAAFVSGISALALSCYLAEGESPNPIFNCEDLKHTLMTVASRSPFQSMTSRESDAGLRPFLRAG